MNEDKLDNMERKLSEKLSDYIDKLNNEIEPPEHSDNTEAQDQMDELYAAVRKIRSLRETVMPEDEQIKSTTKQIAHRIAKEMDRNSKGMEGSNMRLVYPKISKKTTARKTRRLWFTGAAAAVILLAVIVFNFLLPINGYNIVNAMEQAYQRINAYHGTIVITDINDLGQVNEQAVIEVWVDDENRYFMKNTTGINTGLLTVNNGQQKWQLDPEQKQARLFSSFPDAYRFSFQLGSEIEDVKNALEIKIIGEENVAGRKAEILEIVPDGGNPYRLWVDRETRLPLQKESSIYNALKYRMTYRDIEFIDAIPGELLTYTLPEGYTEIDNDPEQVVNSLEEAAEIVEFMPLMPENTPDGYRLHKISVGISDKSSRLYFVENDGDKRVVIIQCTGDDVFKPASTAILGNIKGSVAEIQSPVQAETGVLSGGGAYSGISDITSVRWQKFGFEYAVIGDVSLDQLAEFVAGLSGGVLEVPADISDEAGTGFDPQVEVQVDMEIERNEQKSADAGHSPWKLDPLYVAQVFISLEMSPEGIMGDYPVEYEGLIMSSNTGIAAVINVEDKNSPIARVYLRRLVRQDNTGIWTVVGYDPA